MCILLDDMYVYDCLMMVYFCETHTCLTEKLVHLADDYRIAGKRTITYEYAIVEFILEDGFPSMTGNSCDGFPSGVSMKRKLSDG